MLLKKSRLYYLIFKMHQPDLTEFYLRLQFFCCVMTQYRVAAEVMVHTNGCANLKMHITCIYFFPVFMHTPDTLHPVKTTSCHIEAAVCSLPVKDILLTHAIYLNWNVEPTFKESISANHPSTPTCSAEGHSRRLTMAIEGGNERQKHLPEHRIRSCVILEFQLF